MRTNTLFIVALIASITACNALDEPAAEQGQRTVIPTDERPAVAALTAAPIGGGTLATSADGRYAVASDPDRARLSIVDLSTREVRQVELSATDEPGRVVLDAQGSAFVALRRAGDVIRVRVDQAEIVGRTHVCSAARGLVLQGEALHVACADGKLVSLDAELAVQRKLTLDSDLRDVVVRGDQLWVSTFKQAGLIEVDTQGEIAQRANAQPFSMRTFRAAAQETQSSASLAPQQLDFRQRAMVPHVAWRTVVSAQGNVLMLHQGETTEEVEIDHTPTPSADGASSYGGGGALGPDGCGDGIVTSALTMLDADDVVQTVPVDTGVLAVDMAVVATARTTKVAIVQAGSRDLEAPRPSIVFDSSSPSPTIGTPSSPATAVRAASVPVSGGTSAVSVVEVPGQSQPYSEPRCGYGTELRFAVPGQATAVAFTDSAMLVQSREPALLTLIPRVLWDAEFVTPFGGVPEQEVVALGDSSVLDTGHEIFHRDAGGGIACASCHAEGAEDGHTWSFSGIGERRTQPLHIGLPGTEPFHWNGDESNLAELMTDVFVGRMGGVPQSDPRLSSLTRFLAGLQPPAAIEAPDSEEALRGRALFQASGCGSCHSGVKLTNNRSEDVGTGRALQVPSLIGVGYRAPFMHTGCAATLEARFDPQCGGAKHGDIAKLSTADVSDLVRYLQTL